METDSVGDEVCALYAYSTHGRCEVQVAQVVRDDTAESGFQFLIHPFCLDIGLWVVTRAEIDLSP